ncbi:MAG: DUF6722 family protein [Pseudomonadota bacterium]
MKNRKTIYPKFSYDIAKIILAVTIIGPIARPETFHSSLLAGGFVVSTLFFIFGYLLDAKEVKS